MLLSNLPKTLAVVRVSTRLPARFCDDPFCLGEIWHEWGCCSSASELAAAMDFDHVDDDRCMTLDGCGFDGNVLIPANKVGGVAERRFAQPTNETEIDKIETALGT